MRFPQALIVAALLPLASCYRPAPCKHPSPGTRHSQPSSTQAGAQSQGAPGQVRINTLATSPGSGWLWLEGCWYWNSEDWVWLSQQWMPPGGSVSHVGPEGGGRDDYCVYTPEASEPLPIAMPWPPDVNYGRSVQTVVIHGAYGTRHPHGWNDHNLPVETVRGHHSGAPVRDHRGPSRRNEVVPSVRGVPRPSVRDPRVQVPVVDLVVRPPRSAPPTVTPPRPEAPTAGPVSRPPPPRIHRPGPTNTRPAAPVARPVAPAAPPRSRPAPPRPSRPTPPKSRPAPSRAQPRPARPQPPSPKRAAPAPGRAKPPSRSAPARDPQPRRGRRR